MTDALAIAGPNAEQIEYWNEKTGPKWVALQQQIDARIASLGLLAIERAAAAPGERVIDVGCGCGQSTLELAARVGPRGEVRGVDISHVMLARARERARDAGLAQVRFDVADAQTHRFEPGTIDLVYSRFGVMFFADPTAAFANLRRALRAGGRLVFVCWRPLAENPWAALPFAALSTFLPPPPPPPPGAPGPFSLGDADRVRDILERAGFPSPEIAAHDSTLDLADGGGIHTAVGFAFAAGPASRMLEEADDAQRARAAQVLRDALKPHARGQSVPLAAAVWIVSARNPG